MWDVLVGTEVLIQGYTIIVDLLILPLGDSQVILDIVWLKRLGPTLWDFNNQTLKF